MPAFIVKIFTFLSGTSFVTFIASLFAVSTYTLLKSLGVGLVTFSISIGIINAIEALMYSRLDELTQLSTIVLYSVDAVNLDLLASTIITAITFRISLKIFSRTSLTDRDYVT